MNTVLQLLEDHDICSLAALIGILCFVGSKMVETDSASYRWSLRLGAVAFVAYCVYRCFTTKYLDANILAGVAFRGLFAATLTIGVAWIVLPMVAFMYRGTIGALVAKMRNVMAAHRRCTTEREARRQEEERRRKEREEYERKAPERERARREAEAKAEAQVRARRAAARANCELLYSRYAHAIGQRFTKAMFDDFMRKHLGEEHSAEHVEERARELQTVLQEHFAQIQTMPKDMAALATWFEQQKQQLEALPIDGKAKRVHLANLNRRFQELMTEHLERSGP